MAQKKSSLRSLLTGGDRRSIARSKDAKAAVEQDPARIAELAALTEDRDWLVAMRALDLLEKFAHEHPDWVQPHKAVFVGPLAASEAWEIRLQIVRALPLFRWTRRERTRVISILRDNLAHRQKFVRAWALDSLATLAADDPTLSEIVEAELSNFERSASKSLQARARLIRARQLRG